MENHLFDTGMVTLHYAEGPRSGPPLLLLHGGTARWQSFETILPELMEQWHIYAPDFRGHGSSGRVAHRYRLQDYTSDTVAFLQGVVREPCAIFGHSLGGIVALMLAAQYPQWVKLVIAGDSPLGNASWHALLIKSRARLTAWRDLAGDRLPLAALVEALKASPIEVAGRAEPATLLETFGADSPVYAGLAANLRQTDPDTLSALIDELEETTRGFETDQLMPNIRCPVLLLQADPAYGAAMTDDDVRRALPLLRRGTHLRISGMSHVLHNERKEPVLAAIRQFLSTVAE